MKLNFIKKEKIKNLASGLFCIICFFLVMQWLGVMSELCYAVENVMMDAAGYESREYMVSDEGKEATPIFTGMYIEQEIYIPQRMVDVGKIMLDVSVANYGRINQGQLVIKVYQDDVEKVYIMDMSKVTRDRRLHLIADTAGLKEGEIYVNIYCPEGTGENCIAVYVVDNTDVYSGLIISGETTEKNACINVSIPSGFAKSDFVEVNVE